MRLVVCVAATAAIAVGALITAVPTAGTAAIASPAMRAALRETFPSTAAVPITVAPAPSATAPVGDPQQMLADALRRLPPGLWEFLSARGWTIKVGPPMRGYVAGTWRPTKTSAVLFRPNMTFEDVLGDVAHEVGHMVDFECLTDADRSAILSARGRSTTAWFPVTSGDDRRWGVGDWAETFAETVTGGWDGLWANPGLRGANALVAAHRCPA